MKRSLVVGLCAALWMAGIGGSAAGAPARPAAGGFTVEVDFSTLTLTPVGANCRLHVAGAAELTGTLEGTATGATSALVRASCDDVLAHPPGTFPDVFRSELDFTGTVDGEPVTARIVYHGTAEEGGAIRAVMNLAGDVSGALQVQGQLAVGGEYAGQVVLR